MSRRFVQGLRRFSRYENYNNTSKTYDDFRKPNDLYIIRRHLTQLAQAQHQSLAALKLLDAGCGSGNYLTALIKDIPRAKGKRSICNF